MLTVVQDLQPGDQHSEEDISDSLKKQCTVEALLY